MTVMRTCIVSVAAALAAGIAMPVRASFLAALTWLCCSTLHAAQPELPFTLEQLSIGLPEDGAPRAVVGPHAVFAATGTRLRAMPFRTRKLRA